MFGLKRARDKASADAAANAVQSLRQVLDAASEITRISLQTPLVAFNASVEAKRAGDAGRGFGVVADAVKDLAARVEATSKTISSTISALDNDIGVLARDLSPKDLLRLRNTARCRGAPQRF